MMNVTALLRRLVGSDCHQHSQHSPGDLPRIMIVGSPNVGKSALFNRLTGRYVTVSNYPGTTVAISHGRSKILSGSFEVVDTPGMYSLSPITEEEQVACSLLTGEAAHVVLHVIDAKNIERMLGLTLQLIEAGLSVILVLNMADEARHMDVRIDTERLSELLGIPAVETVATTGEGVAELAKRIGEVEAGAGPAGDGRIHYGADLEKAIAEIVTPLDGGAISPRTKALLLLQEEPGETQGLVEQVGKEHAEHIGRVVRDVRAELDHSVHYHVTLAARRKVSQILDAAVKFPAEHRMGFRETLSRFCMRPLTGIPLLLMVLYFGLYKFVGEFGAGTMVDFVETSIFEEHVNPWFRWAVSAVVPWQIVRDLFIGEYGILTLGVRYAVAIVLPIVATFFIAFSILEDSGYLPRLAMLIDRAFKKIGLNGRAVIPMVLGFGCATMATMVTRTLETRREKIIASVLLAFAIPCSAQLGVILALLSGRPYALLAWVVFVGLAFLLAGLLGAWVLPGKKPSFYMELPPLRMPKIGNVVVKTYTRVVWYFKEIFPLFIIASLFIWIGQVTGIFQWLIRGLVPVVRVLGLPDGAAVAFLFGFFRRDYGAAGLFDLQKNAVMTGAQLAVAAITLTLFLPCIAQFLILKKERGWKVALATGGGILVAAFMAGFAANNLFAVLGVEL